MVIQNAINSLITPQATNKVYGVVKRQAIAQGRLDSSGFPNSITANSGLSITINAATTPLRINFAAGFDTLGVAIDFCGIFNINLIFSGLPINTTHYFYLERDLLTGLASATRIAIAPVYGRVAPSSPATGLHWFKTSEDSLTSQPGMTMYEWSGSAWVSRQRVFLGEVATGGFAVTSIANYAYNRRYESDWVSWSGETIYAAGHNLGIPLSGATWSFVGRASASDTTENLCPQSIAATNYGVFPFGAGTRLNQPFLIGNGGAYFNGTNWVGAGQIKGTIQINW